MVQDMLAKRRDILIFKEVNKVISPISKNRINHYNYDFDANRRLGNETLTSYVGIYGKDFLKEILKNGKN